MVKSAKDKKKRVKLLNVFKNKLLVFSTNPKTDFYRDYCCNTGLNDTGIYTVCDIMEEKFRNFSSISG